MGGLGGPVVKSMGVFLAGGVGMRVVVVVLVGTWGVEAGSLVTRVRRCL